MATKVKAYRVNEETLKRNAIPNYNDLADGVAQVSPVKIRNMGSYFYHVAEDAKGQVYLIEDSIVDQYKLYERNLGVTETKYMLDGVGINQIKAYKAQQEAEQVLNQAVDEVLEESTLQVQEEPVKLNEEVSPEGEVEASSEEVVEESPQRENEIEEETKDQGE